jgi:beta-glucosidase
MCSPWPPPVRSAPAAGRTSPRGKSGAATPAPGGAGAAAGPPAPAFPTGFGWGASTSAYQIEGAAAGDGRGPSVWDVFSHQAGRTKGGDTGDVAADHYHRYYEDLDIMKDLGLKSYRFSISWSRVLPTGRGNVNGKGLDFYHKLVDGLLSRGIAPVATLFHWDTPQALQEQGGWEKRDCAQWFADYAAKMFYSLGDKVPTWLTVNEPKTVVDVAYTSGQHAPGKLDRRLGNVVGHHLLLGHGLAVQAFRGTTGRAASARPSTCRRPTPPTTPPRRASRRRSPTARRTAAAHRAIQAGVNLESFHVWSLLDNFEWAEGFSQRWGLIHVDYASHQRTRKASADWYRNVIARNGV